MIVEMENIKENIQLKRPEIRKWIWVEFFFDELLMSSMKESNHSFHVGWTDKYRGC